MLITDTDFRENRSLLSTTFLIITVNLCEAPTKSHSFYCGPYGPKLLWALRAQIKNFEAVEQMLEGGILKLKSTRDKCPKEEEK